MSDLIPYVVVSGKNKNAVLRIVSKRTKEFPLTNDGCIAAGIYLFKKRFAFWNYSSECDFAQEHKRWFTGDVRELVEQAYSREAIKKYPKEVWKLKVANDETDLGYSAWIEANVSKGKKVEVIF